MTNKERLVITTELEKSNFQLGSEFRNYFMSETRCDSSRSCENLIDETRDVKRYKKMSDVKMSPHKDVNDIVTNVRRSGNTNSVVNWDQVCVELRTQALDFFKANVNAKVAIFSRSELIKIINENANREKKDYWTKTSTYAKEKTKLADEMAISQARYNGKFNELVKDNADFVRIDKNRRKYLAVKKTSKK